MKRPLTIVGYLDYWFDSVLSGVWLLLLLFVEFVVWFFFCTFFMFGFCFACTRYAFLLCSLSLCFSLANFGVWYVEYTYIWIKCCLSLSIQSYSFEWVGDECVSVCALLYTCNKQRHQVFNIRNKNEATTNARICYVYRIYRFKRYMWQIYVSSTISVTRLTLPLLLCIVPFHSLVYVILHLFCLLFTLSLYRNWSLWAILSRDYHG